LPMTWWGNSSIGTVSAEPVMVDFLPRSVVTESHEIYAFQIYFKFKIIFNLLILLILLILIKI
ncbi:MAG: hypothetical protein ACO3OZ_14815, partial [bacterium]